jgi:hypothetical protein
MKVWAYHRLPPSACATVPRGSATASPRCLSLTDVLVAATSPCPATPRTVNSGTPPTPRPVRPARRPFPLPRPPCSAPLACARRSLCSVLALGGRLLPGRKRAFFEGGGRLAGPCKGPLQCRVRHARPAQSLSPGPIPGPADPLPALTNL